MNTNEIENNKKKSKSFKLAFLVIVVVAIISLIGFAFARYITQLNGNTEAQIARWNFNVTAGSSQNLDIDLSQTRFANDTQEVDRTKVAPGTSGALVLNVNATNTQVSLQYDIDIDLTEIPENLIFYSDSNMTNAIYKENEIIHLDGYFDQGANNKTEAKTLYWQWPIETGSTQNEIDANDLLDSNWIGTQPEISIQVTGRQVMQEQEINKYAVTFDANGGTLQGYGNSSQATKMVTYGENYGILPTPTREGYIFKGWNGKNLLNLQVNESFPSDTASSNTVKRILEPNTFIQGLAFNNYYHTPYANLQSINANNIELSASANYGIGFPILSESNKNYTIQYSAYSSSAANPLFSIMYYKEDGTFIDDDDKGARGDNTIFVTTPTDTFYIVICFCGHADSIIFSNIQLEEGTTATAYEPYYITSSTEVVQKQNHTLTAIWEPTSN